MSLYVRLRFFGLHFDPDKFTETTELIPDDFRYGDTHPSAPKGRRRFAKPLPSDWELVSRLPQEVTELSLHLIDIYERIAPHLHYVAQLIGEQPDLKISLMVSSDNVTDHRMTQENIQQLARLGASLDIFAYFSRNSTDPHIIELPANPENWSEIVRANRISPVMSARLKLFGLYFDPDGFTEMTGLKPSVVKYGEEHPRAPKDRIGLAEPLQSSWELISRLPQEEVEITLHFMDIYERIARHIPYVSQLVKEQPDLRVCLIVSSWDLSDHYTTREIIQHLASIGASLDICAYFSREPT